jgi:hypothetical protein
MVQLRSTVTLLAALAASADAFAVVPSAQLSRQRGTATTTTAVSMAGEEKSETEFVSSVFKKELAFDEKTGRFYETGFGEGECIPDEEYCMLDKETGDSIRLTVEEKERIFLDALQVSKCLFLHILSRGETDNNWLECRKHNPGFSPIVACSPHSLRFSTRFRPTTRAGESSSAIASSTY